MDPLEFEVGARGVWQFVVGVVVRLRPVWRIYRCVVVLGRKLVGICFHLTVGDPAKAAKLAQRKKEMLEMGSVIHL